jgi:hypothetical protein
LEGALVVVVLALNAGTLNRCQQLSMQPRCGAAPNQHLQLTKARYLRRPPRLIFGRAGRAAAVAQRLCS